MVKLAGVGDGAVQAATGRGWQAWLALLDEAGAASMSHQEIVALVGRHEGVNSWWQQQITVGYEQARGKRETHEKPGGFEISRSRTFPVHVEALYEAWSEAGKRRAWLGQELTDVRLTSPGKSVWLTWTDGQTQVNARFYARNSHKSQVTVRHTKLSDAESAAAMKAFWAEKLQSLAAFLAP